MAKRGEALELAVLGLLHEAPLHGYELRKRVTGVLGWGRVLSYGSLYPCLKALLRDGLIVEDPPRRSCRSAPLRGADGAPRSSTSSPPTARSASRRSCPRPGRARGTTTTSESTSRSSAPPPPRPGSASSKVGAAGSRSGSTGRPHVAVALARASRRLHPRAPAARARVGRARSALAERAHRQRAGRRRPRRHRQPAAVTTSTEPGDPVACKQPGMRRAVWARFV